MLTISKLEFSRKANIIVRKIKPNILIFIDPFSSHFINDIGSKKILITHNVIPRKFIPKDKLSINWKGKLFANINIIIEDRFYKRTDTIVSLNKEIKNYLDIAGYKSVLIPNGICIECYTPANSDENYILYGGRLVKEKGVNYLIQAYSLLPNELKSVYKLIIVGFGPEETYLKQLAIKLGIKNNVRFIPWLISKEFVKVISKCSVFVLPSLYETFGIVLLESMALGKPVISSNVSGPKDIIINGYNGILFEKGSVSELKNLLELILNDEDLRKNMGINARKTIEDNYIFDKISHMYENLFNELLTGN
jgi:glycosyltransferase involved in cell wall biosynthesis